ncbi:MAG: L-2-hydroxyglutarate oxidase [Candidatus Korobacteraceae bacterium]
MQNYDVVIVGGGIVGIATAMELMRRSPSLRLLVLEKEDRTAAHQSSHNSGVIHSGVYYRPGSLRAKLCVTGAQEMLAFCRKHGIPYDVCGKVIVATQAAELSRLDELERRGKANGVPGLERIGPERLRELEPHVTGIAALHVPGAAITDYGAVTRRMAELLQESGGEIRTRAEVRGISRRGKEIVLETTQGEFSAGYMVNCAGLFSDRIAQMAGAKVETRIVPFRGEYYELTPERNELVRGLIYPVPDPRFPFLGVHFTRKVRGAVECGPNAVLALRREGYSKSDFDLADAADALGISGFRRMAMRFRRTGAAEMYRSFSKAAFTRSLQTLVPEVRSVDQRPGGSGVRAQALNPDGTLVDDFCFSQGEHVLHVLNVPSPAATASIVIGRAVADMAESALPATVCR